MQAPPGIFLFFTSSFVAALLRPGELRLDL
jgi:hypothetical protein